jgi:3-hydroxyisobutyrate dehydrogenase
VSIDGMGMGRINAIDGNREIEDRVGIIGLGSMGWSMARCLVEGGVATVGFDVGEEQRKRAAACGVEVVASGADVAAGAGVVLISVPGPTELLDATIGEGGALGGAWAKTVLVSVSTVSVESIRQVGTAGDAAGVAVLDAPVSGSPRLAERGQLTIMVGGTEDSFTRCGAVLNRLGRRVVYVGDLGAATATKLICNMLWLTNVISLIEGLTLGALAGLSPRDLVSVIRQSDASSAVAVGDADCLLDGDDDPSFSLDLACKDLALIRELAGKANLSLRVLDVVNGHFSAGRDELGGRVGALGVCRVMPGWSAVRSGKPV